MLAAMVKRQRQYLVPNGSRFDPRQGKDFKFHPGTIIIMDVRAEPQLLVSAPKCLSQVPNPSAVGKNIYIRFC